MIPKFRIWEHDVKFMNDQVRITYNPFGSNKIFVEATEGFGWKDVDEKYLMQSTGKKDMYGDDVYVHDIIWDDYDDEFGVVKYDEVDAEFIIEWETHTESLSDRIDILEVVGNIHEHPELLNQPNE